MKTAEEMAQFCQSQHLTIGFNTGLAKRRDINNFGVIERALWPDEEVVFAFPGRCNYHSLFCNEGIFAYAITNQRVLAGKGESNLKIMGLDSISQISYLYQSRYNIMLSNGIVFLSIAFFSKYQSDLIMAQLRAVCPNAQIEENLSVPSKKEKKQPKKQGGASRMQLPEFPLQNKDGLDLMKTVSFTLSGVNHTHNGSNPQAVIRDNNLKGQWLTLTPIVNNPYDDTPVQVEYQGQYIGWLPATNVTLKEQDAKIMIFRRLMRQQEVLARCDDITTIQIGGWDLDELDPEIKDYLWKSPRITCAIYEAPRGRRST